MRAPEDSASRLRWQLRDGSALPAHWLKNDRWSNGRGMRIDLYPDERDRDRAVDIILLADAQSDWAISTRIERTMAASDVLTPRK